MLFDRLPVYIHKMYHEIDKETKESIRDFISREQKKYSSSKSKVNCSFQNHEFLTEYKKMG